MKKWVKGSFTVETVFILPIILAVILTLMYMSLILHDKVVMQSVAEQGLVRCNQLYHQPSDVLTSEIHYSKLLDVSLLGESDELHKEEIRYYMEHELKGRLFICELSSIEIELDVDSCEIQVHANSRVSLPLVMDYLTNQRKLIVVEQREYHHPENFARKAEVIMGTVSQIKGVDKITKFLGQVGDFLGKN